MTLWMPLALSLTAADPSCADVVKSWTNLVESGCKLRKVEDQMPVVLKVLRNTPYAARGYTFKSQELGAFFTKAKSSCKSTWYAAKTTRVEITGTELACAKKLKDREKKLRATMPMPKALEVLLLTEHAGSILDEVKRNVEGHGNGSRVYVTHDAKSWDLNFYEETDAGDGEVSESSMLIQCNAAGEECKIGFAG